jgi:hypothetical protein
MALARALGMSALVIAVCPCSDVTYADHPVEGAQGAHFFRPSGTVLPRLRRKRTHTPLLYYSPIVAF